MESAKIVGNAIYHHFRRIAPSVVFAQCVHTPPRPHCGRAIGLVAFILLTLGGTVPLVRADAPPPVSLAADLPSGQPVGTTVTWTAAATGMNVPVYRFSLGPSGGPYSVLRDFSPTSTVAWTPLREGSYDVRVTAKDGYTGTIPGEVTTPFTVTSRVTGSTAVVTPTANPLVALYSAPPCSEGQAVAMFRPIGGSTWTYTAAQPCQPGQSLNFLVAGMRANASYVLRHIVISQAGTMTSAPRSFTTGAPPSSFVFPLFTVRQGPDPGTDLQESTVVHLLLTTSPNVPNLLATDLEGNVVWYYDTMRSGLAAVTPVRLEPGGTALLFGSDGNRPAYDVLREVDLAGDPVRETNVGAVNTQLAVRGLESIYSFHHEALRLPNGDTAVLGTTEQIVNGHDMVGDMLIVLDADFQVAWTWDAFDHLDPARRATLGEICGYPACPNYQAEDWLHSNSIGWSPADGDLTLSMRHQDWVIKIDYRSGAGDGHVVWRLGQGGDFNITSTDPYPWFSHQHDAHYIDPTTMILFDDGNTRCQGSASPCDSRGQVFSLDEQRHVATPLLNADLGNYSTFLGSAERLPNGDYAFGSGGVGQSIEVNQNGATVYAQGDSFAEYRSYRVDDLYGGTDPALAPCTDLLACSIPTSTNTPAPQTSTNTPPTNTPAPPTLTPVATPTDSSLPPTSTPAPMNTPVTPPMNTPVTLPTATAAINTPVTPPMNTPITPPTNTPVSPPTSTPVTPPMNTPVTPPIHTPIAPPTPVTKASSTTRGPQPTPDPSPTKSVKRTAKPTAQSSVRRVTVRAPRGVLTSGVVITVTVRGDPRTSFSLAVQLEAQSAKHRLRPVVLYRRTLHATTDTHGLVMVRVPLAYNPRTVVPAVLVVTALMPHGRATQSLHLTMSPRRPEPHHPAHTSTHAAPAHTIQRGSAQTKQFSLLLTLAHLETAVTCDECTWDMQ